MPGKKPGTKTSKLKKAPSAKAAPRRAAPSRPEPRKSVVASRKAAPATVTALKPESRIPKKPDRDLERMRPARHAPIISTLSSDRPASAALGSITARTRLLGIGADWTIVEGQNVQVGYENNTEKYGDSNNPDTTRRTNSIRAGWSWSGRT